MKLVAPQKSFLKSSTMLSPSSMTNQTGESEDSEIPVILEA